MGSGSVWWCPVTVQGTLGTDGTQDRAYSKMLSLQETVLQLSVGEAGHSGRAKALSCTA